MELDPTFEILDVEPLAILLREFYAEAVTEKGKPYSRQGLINLSSDLNRHLTSAPFNKMTDLCKDRDFMQANKVLKGKMRITKQSGQMKAKQPKVVSKHDLQKMYDFVCSNLDDPETLLYKVYLDIAFYTGRRGREGLRDLTLSSFEIRHTPEGRKILRYDPHPKKRRNNKAMRRQMPGSNLLKPML